MYLPANRCDRIAEDRSHRLFARKYNLVSTFKIYFSISNVKILDRNFLN